jgi:hypothetical protein
LSGKIDEEEKTIFNDSLLFQVRLHLSGIKGMYYLCKAVLSSDSSLSLAFVYASKSLWAYKDGLQAMRDSEHGKWKNFYKADWLTNISITVYAVDSLRRSYRSWGDGPDYFKWYKEFIIPEGEKKIYLENTHRRPRSDDELAELLEEQLL